MKSHLLILILLLSVFAASCNMMKNEYSNRLEAGNKLMDQGKFAAAFNQYSAAVVLKPNDARAYNNEAAALNRLKKHDEAVLVSEMALKLDPKNAVSYINIGNAMKLRERYPEALVEYDKATKIDTENSLAFEEKADTLFLLRRHAEAADAAQKSLTIGPVRLRPVQILVLSLSYTNSRGYPAALENALRAFPNYYLFHVLKGRLYLESGDLANSEAECYKALAQSSADDAYQQGQCRQFRADILVKQKDYKSALVEYDVLLNLDKDFPGFKSARGELLYRMGRYSEAADMFRQAITGKQTDYNQDDSALRVSLAMALMHKGGAADRKQASEAVAMVLSQTSDPYVIAKAYAAVGKKANALNSLMLAVSDNPSYKKHSMQELVLEPYTSDVEFKKIVRQ